MHRHLSRRLGAVLAVLGMAAVPPLTPGAALPGEPGTTWDPVQILHCAQLVEEFADLEQERDAALQAGDSDAAGYYDSLAQDNLAEQEAWNCDAQPMPAPAPGISIDEPREALAPKLGLEHIDLGGNTIDRNDVAVHPRAPRG